MEQDEDPRALAAAISDGGPIRAGNARARRNEGEDSDEMPGHENPRALAEQIYNRTTFRSSGSALERDGTTIEINSTTDEEDHE